jgi:Asp-tRNA(Asn)/Glu-tRNA(Gln) amidotransferase A subunit family amidase
VLNRNDYLALDAVAMAEGLRRGDWTAGELTEMAIALAWEHNPALNAITTPDYEGARSLAAELDGGLSPIGPLAGVPFLFKEVAAVAGLPHHHHSRLFDGEVAGEDAPIIAAFRTAGLVSLGTTNTPELCLTITTESVFAGACHNPWKSGYSTGGSSGGSAAAVAAGIVPAAHASDGGGSIRIPASCCGVFGLKPSRGLTPVEAELGKSWSGLSVGHVVTRTVRDSAALLDATALESPLLYPLPARPPSYLRGLEQATRPLRIGVQTRHPFDAPIDPSVQRGLEHAMAQCRELGHQLREVTLPVDYRALSRHAVTITNVHVWQQVQPQLEKRGLALEDAPLESSTRRMAERGREVGAADFVGALDGLRVAALQMQQFHFGIDVVLSPVLTLPPVPHGWLDMDSDDLKDYGQRFARYSGFVALYNATGAPSMSVPLWQNPHGLPIGLCFSADWGQDLLLLQLARDLERLQPRSCFPRPSVLA